MAYWWVNQNRTWRHEIFGEYLWAPQIGSDGRGRVFWNNMTLLEPGDVVNTGTPEGVALSGRFPYLSPGDLVRLEIEGLGSQHQRMVAAW